jgi:MSHA pilin protein MshA
MRANYSQDAFTLIEVVVVIAVLGMLAAFAVPRLTALDTQGRLSTQQALAGSVRSAAALSHALWLAQGRPASVTIDRQTIAMVNGYPNLATIQLALSDFTGYTYTSATGVFARSRGPTCAVTYAQAGAEGAPTVTPEALDRC